jgi:hypothetical protein
MPGGLVFVTVPFNYHRGPIDTMYRPDPSELSNLFIDARPLDETGLGMGESCPRHSARPDVAAAPCLAFPVPFLSLRKWKLSMVRLYTLIVEYQITCTVFEKL